MNITLYSGENCCLCDQAEAMINQLDNYTLTVRKVDVKSNTELYHLYGARIPVVYRKDTQTELSWPFEQNQLKEFLS